MVSWLTWAVAVAPVGTSGTVVASVEDDVVVKPFPKPFLGVIVNVYDTFDANPSKVYVVAGATTLAVYVLGVVVIS